MRSKRLMKQLETRTGRYSADNFATVTCAHITGGGTLSRATTYYRLWCCALSNPCTHAPLCTRKKGRQSAQGDGCLYRELLEREYVVKSAPSCSHYNPFHRAATLLQPRRAGQFERGALIISVPALVPRSATSAAGNASKNAMHEC